MRVDTSGENAVIRFNATDGVPLDQTSRLQLLEIGDTIVVEDDVSMMMTITATSATPPYFEFTGDWVSSPPTTDPHIGSDLVVSFYTGAVDLTNFMPEVEPRMKAGSTTLWSGELSDPTTIDVNLDAGETFAEWRLLGIWHNWALSDINEAQLDIIDTSSHFDANDTDYVIQGASSNIVAVRRKSDTSFAIQWDNNGLWGGPRITSIVGIIRK